MNSIYRMKDIEKNLNVVRFRPLDILVVGATGAGKSSTLNALFQREITRVGRGCDPETMEITSIELNSLLRFWDSPGVGDNVRTDKHYSEEIIETLYKDYYMDGRQYGLIDTVLVVLDGSGRDMGTTYKLLNDVIIPNFQGDRILAAINQADIAMKGRHWNERKNCPDSVLKDFLENKAASIKKRIEEASGLRVCRPVYYSAEKDFNIEGLLDMIIDNMPDRRRDLVA